MPKATTTSEKRGETRGQSPRERVRARAVEAINARIRKAGVEAAWTPESSPPFDEGPASKRARDIYRQLVSALRVATAVDGPAAELVDGWTANVRGFLSTLPSKSREWIEFHASLEPTHALRGPDGWTPLRRLVRHWRSMGVPWQRGAGGAWGRPTGVDLALIAIASLPASALDIDPAEDFDGLRDRVADRVKKELKRAAVEDEHSKKTMDAHPPRYHHP